MKTRDLQTTGFEDLNEVELRETEGGWANVAIGIGMLVAAYCIYEYWNS